MAIICTRNDKVTAALEWLKINNPLYMNIERNSKWVEQAATDNRTLWNARTAQHENADDTTPQLIQKTVHMGIYLTAVVLSGNSHSTFKYVFFN